MSRRQLAVATAVAVLLAGLAFAPGGTTYAAYSDSATVKGNSAGALVWQPNPPAACFDGGATYRQVVYLTDGDDVYTAGNHDEIVMGLGGNDVIHVGNGKDCLVGGDGNDTLYGGNGKDVIDGGDGTDACFGGNGTDVIVDCESGASPALRHQPVTAKPDDPTSAAPAPKTATRTPTPTPTPDDPTTTHAAAPPQDSAPTSSTPVALPGDQGTP